MKLYHGSNILIERIDLSKSKVGKDFGCGFYLSDDYGQALRQAKRRTLIANEGEPVVTTFEIADPANFPTDIKMKVFDSYSEEWANFILLNRRNVEREPAHPYDIVVGPIANDTIGYQIRRFLSQSISLEKFIEEIKFLKGVSMQYYFGTEKALSLLKRIDL